MTAYSKIDKPDVIALLFPSHGTISSPCPANAEDVEFEAEPGIILNYRSYFVNREAPVLFFYPAIGVSLDSFDMIAEKYLNQGMNVFVASYRGCGNNNGSPSVGAMYQDSEKLFPEVLDWLKQRQCSGPLFVMGQSLGSICAIDSVFRNGDSVKGLIIESGIGETASFLAAMGVPLEKIAFLEEEGFNNLEKIEKITVPTLIFHGSRDQLVTIAEAENLQASSGARTKQFFVIPGAEHHTVSETGGELYIKTIKQFTDTVCGVNTWRQKRRSHKRNQKG